MIIILDSTPVAWQSVKQTLVSKSTIEAEFYALSHTAGELLAMQRLLTQISHKLALPSAIVCDNANAVRIVDSSVPPLHTKLKHVDVQQHWLRQTIQQRNNEIVVKWIQTQDMPADGLTKALSPPKFNRFLELISMVDAVLPTAKAEDVEDEEDSLN